MLAKELVLFGPYPPPYGGVSIFVQQLAEQLQSRQIPFILKKFHGISTESDAVQPTMESVLRHFGGLKAYSVMLDNGSFFLEYPATQASRRARWGLQWSWLGLKMVKRFKWIKVVHDGTLIERYPTFAPHQQRAFQRYAASVDEFVAVSPTLAGWLETTISRKKPVHVISSLLPFTEHETAGLPTEAAASVFRADYVVCSVGVFIENYGFDQIAQAIETLRTETGRRINLLLIDAGFTGVDRFRQEILRDRPWITVLTQLPHAQVINVIKRSQAFVRGVRSESYGLSKVEAIWCHVPVVATKTGETRGMLLYDFGDHAGLVTQLRAALFDSTHLNIERWSAIYRAEADANLNRLLSVIDLNGKFYDPG
jgi:glycosyltransferase involved in cell wall biosynthesis